MMLVVCLIDCFISDPLCWRMEAIVRIHPDPTAWVHRACISTQSLSWCCLMQASLRKHEGAWRYTEWFLKERKDQIWSSVRKCKCMRTCPADREEQVWFFSLLQDINFRLVFMVLDTICPDTSALRKPRPNCESDLALSCRDMRPVFAVASRSFKFCFLRIGLTSGFYFFSMCGWLLWVKFIPLQCNDPRFAYGTSQYYGC